MKAAYPRHFGVFAIPSTFGKFNAIVTQDSRAMIGTVKQREIQSSPDR